MTTLYLKTATEAEMKAALAGALPGFVGADENGDEVLRCYTHQWAVLWGPAITAVPAVVALDGTVTTPAVMEPGFFANVEIIDPSLDVSSLAALDRKPNDPQYEWAGAS